jgi:hypothetical protein
MSYHGDIRLGDTIDIKFVTTAVATGAPTQLAGSPVISAYVGNGTTQLTAGITLTVDFDSVTGLNNVRVVATSGNGYATATNVQLVITTGTVGGTSVVGYVVGTFSIEARSAVMPTVAARTLDVTATGAAGIDWGNVENPTTALNLSGTNIDVDQVVASVSGTVATVTNLTNLPTIPANWLTAAGTAADFTTEIQSGLATAANLSTVAGYLDTEIAAILAAVDTEIATLQTSVNDLPTNAELATALGTADDAVLSAVSTLQTSVNDLPTNAELATALGTADDAVLAAVATVDTVVDAIKVKTDQFVFTIANQVDSNVLTGGGSGLDAAGTRAALGLASANLDTQLSTIDTVVDSVKVKTDQLTFTKANELDANIQSVNDVTVAGTGAPGDEWGP